MNSASMLPELPNRIEFSNHAEEEEDREETQPLPSEKQTKVFPAEYYQNIISTSINEKNFSDSLVYVMPSDENSNRCSREISSPPVSTLKSNDHETKTSGSRWRDDETGNLVQIWRDKIYQTRWWKQSRGVRVNKEMWEEISHLLTKRDVYRTPSQCQIRMKNLLQFYRQTTENRKSEKTTNVLPDYFDIVDKIMTRKDDPIYDSIYNHQKYYGFKNSFSSEDNQEMSQNDLKISSENTETRSFSSPTLFEEERTTRKRKSSERSLQSLTDLFQMKRRPFAETTTTTSPSTIMTTSALSTDKKQRLLKTSYHRNNGNSSNRLNNSHNLLTVQNGHPVLEKNFPRNCCYGHPNRKVCFNGEVNPEDYMSSKCDHARRQEEEEQPLYLQGYSSPKENTSRLPSRLTNGQNHHDTLSNNHPSNNDILQLHYKQIETLLDIERRRLIVEEERLKEEKEANNRTGAFLLEAVKILAETFRNNTNNTVCSE